MAAAAGGPEPTERRLLAGGAAVGGPTMTQVPLVLVKPTKVEGAGGVSVRLTKSAAREPMLLTSIV